MQKSLLIEILTGFDKKEWRDLEKWLHADLHNQRKDVRKLFAFLQQNIPDTEKLTKKSAWKALFPKATYDDAQMRQVMYFLTEATQEFLSFAQMQENPSTKQLTLLDYYRRRGLEKPFNKTANSLRRKLNAQALRNSLYLDQLYRLERETFDFKATQRRSDSLHLQETGDALDLSFIATKLRIGCAMQSHQSINRTLQYDEGLLAILLTYIKERQLEEQPAIAGFYYGYMLGAGADGLLYFEKLKAFIKTHPETMSMEELRELYRMALNFCIRQSNTGKTEFVQATFDLYKTGLDLGVLLDASGQISRFTFINSIGAAIKVKAFDWAEAFIENYQNKLDERHQANMVNFNLSRVYFEKQDYDRAQKLLISYEYNDLLFNLLAKTMLLKIYYEEGELDALESLIGSMGAYLKRKESLDDNRRIGYKNFLKIVKKIINLSPSAKAARDKLREKVTETQPLMEREWLDRVLGGR